MFSGTQDKCATCNKTVYPLEKVSYISIFQKDAMLLQLFRSNQTYSEQRYCCSHNLQLTMEGESYHKTCFKCAHGGCILTPSSYAALDGILYCKHHFAQLFKEKGSYNHVIEAATMKKHVSDQTVVPEPAPIATQEQEALIIRA